MSLLYYNKYKYVYGSARIIKILLTTKSQRTQSDTKNNVIFVKLCVLRVSVVSLFLVYLIYEQIFILSIIADEFRNLLF